MKGFVYLLEIAIVAILAVFVLSMFFSIRIKQNWEKSDLISAAYNMLNYIKQDKDSLINILNENVTEIEALRIRNINYNLQVIGVPKSNIKVGCGPVSNCFYIRNLLTPTYVNNRWINFTVTNLDLNASEFPDYDAIIFLGLGNYSEQKSKIDKYLNRGGVLLGINSTSGDKTSPGAIAFSEIFNISDPPVPGGSFREYETIPKYFLGLGFDVIWPNDWVIWTQSWRVIHIDATHVNITNPSGTEFHVVSEGGNFTLINPVDSLTYTFKVRKILYQQRTDIQPLNTTFSFIDFSEGNVIGQYNIINNSAGFALMTSNNTAIWMSDFPDSDEHRTLVKAALASRVSNWFAERHITIRESITVSSFIPLCCDMPETVELYLTLWYEV